MSIPCKMNPLGGGFLPMGYMRLEYLESTGTQYIDTGFLSKDFLDVTIKTDYATLTKTWNFFGAYRQGGYSVYTGATATGGFFLGGVFFSPNSLRYGPVELNFFYKIRLSKEGFWVDNQKIGVFEMYPEAEILKTADPFLLFARFRQDLGEVEKNYMKLKTVDARPLFNMVPALDPTGTPCMYDTLSKKPFYNSGTGEFIVGIENQAQLDNLLRKLPDRTGQDVGTLQVQLADELQTPENEAKLDAMLAKNWEISQAA